MPELPEVETTRRGLEPHLLGHRITDLVVRQPQLRWPVPTGLRQWLVGATIHRLERRAKYLLIAVGEGTLMVHLGMSGTLRVVGMDLPIGRHDHVDIGLEGGAVLRYNDPRRFGSILWIEGDPLLHPLLSQLGPEPLSALFDADYLQQRALRSRRAIKLFLLDQRVVVGVGNIYANEALFHARISPWAEVSTLSHDVWQRLVVAIQQTLGAALSAGGTTLKDFVDSDGRPGYFSQQLQIYGREGEGCRVCGSLIQRHSQGQRSTWHCPLCQSLR